MSQTLNSKGVEAGIDAVFQYADGDARQIAEAVITAYLGAVPESPSDQMMGPTLEDFARRLFDLQGFMLLETYNGKHAVTVTFPNIQEAHQFHGALVELSTYRPRPQSLAEYMAQRSVFEEPEAER